MLLNEWLQNKQHQISDLRNAVGSLLALDQFFGESRILEDVADLAGPDRTAIQIMNDEKTIKNMVRIYY